MDAVSTEDRRAPRNEQQQPLPSILYSSDEFLVIDKPCRMAMDGQRAEATVESWVHRHLGDYMATPLGSAAASSNGASGPQKALKFVHQLDYATSGTLCLAFSRDMAARLAHCFRERQTVKEYVALVHGWVGIPRLSSLPPQVTRRNRTEGTERVGVVPCVDAMPDVTALFQADAGSSGDRHCVSDTFRVDAAIGYDAADATGFRMAIDGRDAKTATSDVTPLEYGHVEMFTTDPEALSVAASTSLKRTIRVRATKVHLRLFTGRRHQLRLHCVLLGHPIVGDDTYSLNYAGDVEKEEEDDNGDGAPLVGQAPLASVRAVQCDAAALHRTNRVACAGLWAPRMMLHSWRISFFADLLMNDAMTTAPIGREASTGPLQDDDDDAVKARKDAKRKRRRETRKMDAPPLLVESPADASPRKWVTFASSDALRPYFLPFASVGSFAPTSIVSTPAAAAAAS